MKNIPRSNIRYDSTEKQKKMEAILPDQANLFYSQQRIRQTLSFLSNAHAK